MGDALRGASEGALVAFNQLRPVMLLGADHCLAFMAMEVKHRLAFVRLAQPGVLRLLELPFLQGFQITVLFHAFGFVEVGDGLAFAFVM